MDDRFRKAEEQYFLLKGQLASGRITQQQFETALKEMLIQDAQGRYWMIGADTGKWYVHDGQAWVEARPSGASPFIPPAPPVAQAQPRGASNMLIITVGAVAVLCLLGIVALLFASSQGIVKIGMASPTNTPFPTIPTVAAPPTVAVPPTVAAFPTITAFPAATSFPIVTPTLKLTPTVTPTLTISDTLAQADALTFQSKFAEAAALYERALQMNPIDALANARWARMLNFQGYLELRNDLTLLALKKAEAASQLGPKDAEIAMRLARAYDWNGTYDKALSAAKNAVQLAPNSAEAYALLSQAHYDNNNLTEAETAARMAIQLDPNSAEGHRSLGWVFYAKKQTEATIAEFEKAAQLEPDLALRHSELATFYWVAKDYAKATAAYQRALALYPQAARAYSGLGGLALDQKQYDQAIDHYNRVIQMNGNAPAGYYGVGQAYYAQDKCTEAIPAFQKTVELNPRANLAMNSLGWCYLKAGDLTAALDWAKKAAALDPNHADTKALLAALATALATPTSPIAPGLYVTNLRLEPPSPGRAQDVSFYATFLNTTGSIQNYRWLVYLYRQDNPNKSFGETARTTTSIPVGSGEQKASGTWRTSVGGCDDVIARVAWLDQNNKATFFAKPDGQVFELAFKVC